MDKKYHSTYIAYNSDSIHDPTKANSSVKKPRPVIMERNAYKKRSLILGDRESHSRFHDFIMTGTDIVMESFPAESDETNETDKTDKTLIKKRELTLRLKFGDRHYGVNHNGFITRNHSLTLRFRYRWGIQESLTAAGYGYWLDDIYKALKNGITRNVSFEVVLV